METFYNILQYCFVTKKNIFWDEHRILEQSGTLLSNRVDHVHFEPVPAQLRRTVTLICSDHKPDVLALTESWHDESFDTCLAAAIIPPGCSIVEQARPVSRKAATSDSFVNTAEL